LIQNQELDKLGLVFNRERYRAPFNQSNRFNKVQYIRSGALLCSLLALTAGAQARELSTADIRTLKNAVTVAHYLPHIRHLAENCSADLVQYLPAVVENADQASLDLLLKQKLQITGAELTDLLKTNEKFAVLTQAAVVTTPSCDDRETILDLTEQFSNNFTALELSDAIPQWQQHFSDRANGAAMGPARLSGLIQSSHSIVLVNIQPKSKLTALQQANYLHIDDKSAYVFEVQQGWKSVAARYHGLHFHLGPDQQPPPQNNWLLMLDSRFHPTTVLQGAELRQALQSLGRADWTFNRQGDLLRAD